MQCIIDTVDTALVDTPVNSDCIFDVNNVKSAVSRLKPHKNEGCSDLSYDHIINAGDDCFIHIACLLTAIVIHGMVPDTFQRSVIVSIPKGRHTNLPDSSNFRGIALSLIIGKIFDNIILQRYNHKLSSCELQFGFKSKSSTNMCTMVMKETITYYVQHQSPVFCTFSDATKAVDRLHFGQLFGLLLERDLPAQVVKTLIYLYTHNYVSTRWREVVSHYFAITNGVEQGAVLSPILFCIYIYNLLKLLADTGVGCYIGSHFVGALAYADDIVLLAPTASVMRRLLAVCD
jgi:hypothetical protein